MAYSRAVSPLSYEPLQPSTTEMVYESDDNSEDDPDERQAKRRRIEECGKNYLKGLPVLIMTASLKGPIQSGWQNPWRKPRRRSAVMRKDKAQTIRRKPQQTSKVIPETALKDAKEVDFQDLPRTKAHRKTKLLPRGEENSTRRRRAESSADGASRDGSWLRKDRHSSISDNEGSQRTPTPVRVATKQPSDVTKFFVPTVNSKRDIEVIDLDPEPSPPVAPEQARPISDDKLVVVQEGQDSAFAEIPLNVVDERTRTPTKRGPTQHISPTSKFPSFHYRAAVEEPFDREADEGSVPTNLKKLPQATRKARRMNFTSSPALLLPTTAAEAHEGTGAADIDVSGPANQKFTQSQGQLQGVSNKILPRLEESHATGAIGHGAVEAERDLRTTSSEITGKSNDSQGFTPNHKIGMSKDAPMVGNGKGNLAIQVDNLTEDNAAVNLEPGVLDFEGHDKGVTIDVAQKVGGEETSLDRPPSLSTQTTKTDAIGTNVPPSAQIVPNVVPRLPSDSTSNVLLQPVEASFDAGVAGETQAETNEVAHQSIECPVEADETTMMLSTQAAISKAQQRFQDDLKTPEHLVHEEQVSTGDDSKAPGDKSKDGIKLFRAINTPSPMVERKLKLVAAAIDERIDTQAMLNAVTPFLLTTVKKIPVKSSSIQGKTMRKERKRASFAPTSQDSSGSSHGSIKSCLKTTKVGNGGEHEKITYSRDDIEVPITDHDKVGQNGQLQVSYLASLQNTSDDTLPGISTLLRGSNHHPAHTKLPTSALPTSQTVPFPSTIASDTSNAIPEAQHPEAQHPARDSMTQEGDPTEFDLADAMDDMGSFLQSWDPEKEARYVGMGHSGSSAFRRRGSQRARASDWMNC